MFNWSRWLFCAVLILIGYLAIRNGWLDFLAHRAQVAGYLRSHGIEGLMVITLAGAVFTAIGAPRQLLAFVLGFVLGGLNGTLASTLATAIGITVNNLGTEEALAYRNNILFKQTGERYADSWGHIQPWYYYLTNVIPALWFPLPLLLLALMRPVKKIIQQRPVILVLLVWVALVVAFFSISPGKRGVYVLPALPMFALSLAPVLSTHRPARWFPPILTGLHLLLAIALIIVGVMAWNNHPGLVEKISAYSQDPAHLHEAGTLVFSVGLVWLASLAVFWRTAPLGRFFIALMINWLLFTTWGYGILEPLRTPRNILAAAEQRLSSNAQIGMIDFKEQFILFSRLDFTHFSYFSNREQEERNAWVWMSQTTDSHLIVEDQHDFRCFTEKGAIFLGTAHRDSYLLLDDEQMKPSCSPPDNVVWFTTPTPGIWQN